MASLLGRYELPRHPFLLLHCVKTPTEQCAKANYYGSLSRAHTHTHTHATHTHTTLSCTAGGSADPDGIDDAFELVAEVNEKVKTGVWVGDCFIYNTASWRLNYCVGGEVGVRVHGLLVCECASGCLCGGRLLCLRHLAVATHMLCVKRSECVKSVCLKFCDCFIHNLHVGEV